MAAQKLHAVVTGDIVESSNLPEDRRRLLPETIRQTYRDLQRESFGQELPYDVAIMGGDGWQCYIEEPRAALTYAISMWARLYRKGITSRMALAVNTVDFIAPNDNLNESDGPAFRQAGRTLQKLEDDRWFECKIPPEAPGVYDLATDAMCELTDFLLHEWTEGQAQAVAAMLKRLYADESVTQQSVAENWKPEPITKQGVGKHLRNAQWKRLVRTIHRFSSLVDDLSDAGERD